VKIRLTEIAKKLNISFEEAMKLKEEKLCSDMAKGKGKNTWIDEEGQAILIDSMDVPEAVPKHHRGVVHSHCRNPNYMYVIIPNPARKVATAVPRKFYNKMRGKKVTIEEIKDVNGSSFRYVPSGRYNQ